MDSDYPGYLQHASPVHTPNYPPDLAGSCLELRPSDDNRVALIVLIQPRPPIRRGLKSYGSSSFLIGAQGEVNALSLLRLVKERQGLLYRFQGQASGQAGNGLF